MPQDLGDRVARDAALGRTAPSRPWHRAVRLLLLAVAGCAGMWALSSCTAAAPLGIGGTITADGAPRLGVEVAVFPSGSTTQPVATTVTDAAGHFSVRPLAAGRYWVRLGGAGWDAGTNHASDSPVDVVVGPGSATVTTDVALLTGGLAGAVTTTPPDTQAPPWMPTMLPDATVDAVSATGTRSVVVASTTTNSSGYYAFPSTALPVGQYVIRFSKPGYLTRWSRTSPTASGADVYTVANGATTSVPDMPLNVPRSITGRVTDGSTAMPGATVNLALSDGTIVSAATTSALGRFTFGDLDPTYYRLLVVPPAPYRTEAWGTRSDPLIQHSLVYNLGAAMPSTPRDAGDDDVAVCDPATFGPNVDFSGQDLSGTDLRGCDLTGATFTATNLTNVKLGGAKVGGATFAGATLQGIRSGGVSGVPTALPANFQLSQGWLLGPEVDLSDELVRIGLSGANLVGANLRRTDLHGSSLTNADLSSAHATDANFSGVTLSGGTYAGTSFDGATFTGASVKSANLTGADFTGAHLASTTWAGSTVNGAIFAGADLTKANMGTATVTGAVLGTATMTGVQSGGVNGLPATLPAGWILVSGYLVGPGADLSFATLDGFDLRSASLSAATLYGTKLAGANLAGIDATSADFSYANLSSTDVRGTRLGGATFLSTLLSANDLSATDFTGAALAGVRSANLTGVPVNLPTSWHLRVGTLMGPGVDLRGFTLTGTDLSDLDLTGAKLGGLYSVTGPGANLTGSDLSRTNFTGADLTNTTVTGTTVTDAVFAGATLSGITSGQLTGTPSSVPVAWRFVNGYLAGPKAILDSAMLTGADLRGADLRRAQMISAHLDGADLSGATLDYMVASHSSFAGAQLAGASMYDTVLDDTTLTSANLTNASMTGTTITGARVDGADLSGATLAMITSGGLSGTPVGVAAGWKATAGFLLGPTANLRGANIAGADLDGVSLLNAELTNVASGGITGIPAVLPTGWRLTQGYVVGPYAYLHNADLRNADLSGLDLDYAETAGANLRGAQVTGTRFGTLTGVRSGAVTGTPASMPAGYALRSGYVFGQSVDLTNEDLTGINASGISLSEANLQGAKLAGANFTGSYGARATGAIYDAAAPTTCPNGWKAPTQVTTCVGNGFYPNATGP